MLEEMMVRYWRLLTQAQTIQSLYERLSLNLMSPAKESQALGCCGTRKKLCLKLA